ncbi:oligopeptide ABC transporter permease [Bacillus suaedaesalsae]|uniref:ABC transporter permease n=1 Tax=Bacillus suaedaesalsae TaxID=2810349 RepID=A0ABS2DL82_9BACI|nr:oligopeptide ABC transporter permease [Bacillus suaedaesalsae]MBM6618281.1 ABC transporter permease [Bacillus suaedaesalsae]
MTKYLLQRIVYMLITLFIIASATFFLMKLMPGTPFSNEAKLTAEQRAVILEKYGLDDPVPVQYVKYVGNLLKGDLGVSFQFDNRGVTDLILDRIGPSAYLGFQAMVIGTILGILLGIVSALYQNTWADYISTLVAIFGIAIPSFIFAGLLQYVLGVELRWFPVAFWEGPKYTVLPTIALLIFPMATAARFIRTEMIEVLHSDYILMARAKGMRKSTIVFKHALRNSLIPLITVIGPMAVGLMTGTLVIEKIFSIPGLGEQFVRSITTNDYPMIMGTTIFFAALFIFIIFVVDVLYGIVDPRIRLAGGKG